MVMNDVANGALHCAEGKKERFVSLCRTVQRDGMDRLLLWLEESDFYTCPASARYHDAFEGGLLEHSLRVYDELCRLLRAYPEIEVPAESVVVAALLHDLCKVNFYTTEKRNRKNAEGKWESYDCYAVNEQFCFGGHGSKSMFLAQRFISLTPLEAVAINCHMASWDGNKDVSGAFEQFPFAWLLHVADEAATFVAHGAE